MAPPSVEPQPPLAECPLPWDTRVADPVAALAAARARHGDTFMVDSGGDRYLFLFSPEGLRSFYALPEDQASKGVADWQMLRKKLPDELFRGRRTLPHELFGRDDVARYLAALTATIDVSFHELGADGVMDVFAFTRRLAHRLGLASWAGEPPATSPRFEQLVASLDRLDASAAFVHPEQMAQVGADGKTDERAALAELEHLLAADVAALDAGAPPPSQAFSDIVARWGGEPEPERTQGIARDVVLVHLGSMSNLFAALGWSLVHAVQRPEVLGQIAGGEPGLAERCALESTRLAQRSIMMRTVLIPVEVRDEGSTYAVGPGVIVATLLPLTNTTAAPGLEGYDPGRWDRRRLRAANQMPARELVTTFGHGSHTCPAQPFSLAAMATVLRRLAEEYELEPRFTSAEPLAGQIGGVARSAAPCTVAYHRRAGR